MLGLYLDDVRSLPDEYEEGDWLVVRDPWEFLKLIMVHGTNVTHWSLDHDLGDGVPTGYDLLKMINFLKEYAKADLHVPEDIVIHSANPVGRINMTTIIERLY